ASACSNRRWSRGSVTSSLVSFASPFLSKAISRSVTERRRGGPSGARAGAGRSSAGWPQAIGARSTAAKKAEESRMEDRIVMRFQFCCEALRSPVRMIVRVRGRAAQDDVEAGGALANLRILHGLEVGRDQLAVDRVADALEHAVAAVARNRR